MLELEEEVDVNDSDDSDDEEDNEINGASSNPDTELGKNTELAEAYFHGSEVELGTVRLTSGLLDICTQPLAVLLQSCHTNSLPIYIFHHFTDVYPTPLPQTIIYLQALSTSSLLTVSAVVNLD